ncbi:hypothetical protein [Nonomuraea rhodomycinica]|uniref:Uncharacterized protein n=1 Tax=Nonomuraea rhodomycinica TaxID=1712872 RepID=A0A7Y6IY87_9ACTN|nr:hypothetical protein [Nonomuraea rhodomycinica]NUW46616.1 hypothetical protein [Nonomuraea rhodomycinica]
MPVGRALALVAGAALVLLTKVIVVVLVLLGAEGLKPEAQVSTATLFDLLKIALAVVALVMGYRRQKVAEAAQRVSERGEERETVKLHNDRFATAAGQLGHDSPAVRLAVIAAACRSSTSSASPSASRTCPRAGTVSALTGG